MVRRLGEILIERGVVTVGELHTALEACHREGGRLGSHLLRFEYVREGSLLQALSEQFGVQPVTTDLLLETPPDLLATVPQEVRERLMVVPFDRRSGILSVAMVNPRDLEAREELARITGMTVQPFVATEPAVLRVMEAAGNGGEPPAAASVDTGPQRKRGSWESLWTPRRVGPKAAGAVRVPEPDGGSCSVATFPDLQSLESGDAGSTDLVLDEESFRDGLRRARHRDEIGKLLLRYTSRLLARVVLLAVHRNRLIGWMAHGPGVVVDDVQAFEASLETPSVFLNLLRSGEYHLGSLQRGATGSALAEALGDPPPEDVVVVPVRVKDRTVAFVVGDAPGEGPSGIPVQELTATARRAGIAFEILILRNKI